MEWHYKRWTDRYPISVEVKGGSMVINPELVIITSQYTPEQIWEGDKTTLEAMRRRLSFVNMESQHGPTDSEQHSPVSSVLPYRAVGPWAIGPLDSHVEGAYQNGYKAIIRYEQC